MSNFTFLQDEFKPIYTNALEAEKDIYQRPRTAAFYCRLALETAIKWMYR